MDILFHEDQEWEVWRGGVLTKLWAAASTGSRELCIGEQIIEPESAAPLHWHYSEEVLTILEGRAEVTIDDEIAIVDRAATVVFPAQSRHGFVNLGPGKLRVIGVFAWPFYETYWADGPEDRFTREWEAQEGGARRILRRFDEA